MSTLPAGITPAGTGNAGSLDVKWNILGHVYWLKAESEDCFAFETLDPPGTFVPPHVHPTQDEFIYMLEGAFDLYLAGSWTKAAAGDTRQALGAEKFSAKPHKDVAFAVIVRAGLVARTFPRAVGSTATRSGPGQGGSQRGERGWVTSLR